MTSIDSDINSTLNTAITTITQTAEKQASIVSDYKVVWGERSQKEKTMQMTVRIMPKEFSDDTQVRVRYSGYSLKGEGYDMVFDTEGFDEQSASAARVESGVYEANITIPLVDLRDLECRGTGRTDGAPGKAGGPVYGVGTGAAASADGGRLRLLQGKRLR